MKFIFSFLYYPCQTNNININIKHQKYEYNIKHPEHDYSENQQPYQGNR